MRWVLRFFLAFNAVALVLDVANLVVFPGNWAVDAVGGLLNAGAMLGWWRALRRDSAGAETSAGASVTSAGRLEPGLVVRVDFGADAELVRVVSTTGTGPFTSLVRPLGRWEAWRLAVWRRVQCGWLRRVWWPVVDWVEDRREAWGWR